MISVIIVALACWYWSWVAAIRAQARVDAACARMQETTRQVIARGNRMASAEMTVTLDNPLHELRNTPHTDWSQAPHATPLEDLRSIRDLTDTRGHAYGCAKFSCGTCDCKNDPDIDAEQDARNDPDWPEVISDE